MRSLLVIALGVLASCDNTASIGDPCAQDSDCASNVCARTDVCASQDGVCAVRVTWTIRGAAPTAAACTAYDPFELDFEGFDGNFVGFVPVPCMAGLFSIDKLPVDLDRVLLGTENSSNAVSATIDVNGNAAIDLP